MTISKASTLPIHSPLEPQVPPPHCTLKWRQGQLLVKPCHQLNQLPALANAQLLAECLSHSPVRLIRIDPDLGEASLTFWADACQQANKTLFLRLPARKLPQQRISWWLRRGIEWLCAAMLLLCLIPLMLGLVLLMRGQFAPCQQWCVGERGKLFHLLEFRLENSDTTPFTGRIRHDSLAKLPQLFNVLRGEMNLLGPHPRTLHDAVRMSPLEQRQLNTLPGIFDLRREMASNLLDADAVKHWELK